MILLTDIFIVEIGNSKIKQNIQEKRKTENGIIESILFGTNDQLNIPVNTEDPVRLDEEIQ